MHRQHGAQAPPGKLCPALVPPELPGGFAGWGCSGCAPTSHGSWTSHTQSELVKPDLRALVAEDL